MGHERAHRWLLISMNSRSTWNYFSLCQSIMRLKIIIYIYIMHKKGTSLRLPVLFTKFRPPKIKRKIFVAKSLSTIKNSPILWERKLLGEMFCHFSTQLFLVCQFFKNNFHSFLRTCGQLMINLFWDDHWYYIRKLAPQNIILFRIFFSQGK